MIEFLRQFDSLSGEVKGISVVLGLITIAVLLFVLGGIFELLETWVERKK